MTAPDLPEVRAHHAALRTRSSNFAPAVAYCEICDWTFAGTSGETYAAMDQHEANPTGSDESSTP